MPGFVAVLAGFPTRLRAASHQTSISTFLAHSRLRAAPFDEPPTQGASAAANGKALLGGHRPGEPGDTEPATHGNAVSTTADTGVQGKFSGDRWVRSRSC
jgi:hypothetical protein